MENTNMKSCTSSRDSSSTTTEETSITKSNDSSSIEISYSYFLQNKSAALNPLFLEHDELSCEFITLSSSIIYAPLLLPHHTTISQISDLAL